eukprot:TRINITY_DN417_c0_g1_i1.p1 TRINITY_DN417_c0_g1~~TRINITY_DN417_c0_g1_i1.p1  ORF type:complete len:406 (+),score=147.00 TRINITY_DN417_c0_g1_i1:78-1295(+)
MIKTFKSIQVNQIKFNLPVNQKILGKLYVEGNQKECKVVVQKINAPTKSQKRFYSSKIDSKSSSIVDKIRFTNQEEVSEEKIIEQAYDLYNGNKCKKNMVECNQLLRNLLENGNKSKSLSKIILYLHGELEEIDMEENEIEQILLESVDKKEKSYLDTLAIHYLGIMKENKRDYENAISFFEMAGCTSYNNLADIYLLGNKKIKKNLPKAIEYFEKSAELGNTDAMFSLYKIYMHLGKNTIKALEYLERASEFGDEDSTYILAQIYENGKNEINRDINKAIAFYQKASELGNISSLVKLGTIYHKGVDGVEKDINKAIFFFEKASECGELAGPMFNLSLIYNKGDVKQGVEKDLEKAYYYFQKAKNIQNNKYTYTQNLFHYQSPSERNIVDNISSSFLTNKNLFV